MQAERRSDSPSLSARNLTGIDDLSDSDIALILSRAQFYADALRDGTVPRVLEGKIILSLFFEDSTRTRTSFDVAANRLGADVVHWNAETSSLKKGESFEDTVRTLSALGPDAIVMRHKEFGAPLTVAKIAACPVINGGDSWRAHPTQALLDALTLKRHFGEIEGRTVAIIGDIAHSRVASSNMELLPRLGVKLRVIAPEVLMPEKLPSDDIEKFTTLEDGLPGADAVITLRLQKERMESALIDSDAAYFKAFGMTHERLDLAGKDAVLLDPGPFLRGVQIDDALADDRSRFLYDRQVANGAPTRMAVLDLFMNKGASSPL